MNNPFTIREVKKSLKQLKNNKAGSCNLVINEMLKYGAPNILPALCKRVNIILDQRFIPDTWNITYQVPVFKAGDPGDCNNYRGIAISSSLGKAYSNILQDRLFEYVENSGNISENQAAFRPGKSTSDHFFLHKESSKSIYSVTEERCVLLFCSFFKAFDSVWREGMYLLTPETRNKWKVL